MVIKTDQLAGVRAYDCLHCPHYGGLANIDRDNLAPCLPVASAYNSFFARNPDVQAMAFRPDVKHEHFISDHAAVVGCTNMRYRLLGENGNVLYESEPFEIDPIYTRRDFVGVRSEYRFGEEHREGLSPIGTAVTLIGTAYLGKEVFDVASNDFASNQIDDPVKLLVGGAFAYFISTPFYKTACETCTHIGGKERSGKYAFPIRAAAFGIAAVASIFEMKEIAEFLGDANVQQLTDTLYVPIVYGIANGINTILRRNKKENL